MNIINRIDRAAIRKLDYFDVTTHRFANVLNGKREEKLGVIYDNAAKAMKLKKNTELCITNSYVRHMDASGHLTGVGFGRNCHNDSRALTKKEVSDIFKIVKTSNRDNIIVGNVVRNRQRYKILSELSGRRQIVVVEVANKQRLDIVTSYILSERRYKEYLKETISRK